MEEINTQRARTKKHVTQAVPYEQKIKVNIACEGCCS